MKQKLRDTIYKSFDLGELKGLCFDLDIVYDDLPGTTISEKTRELVEYCDRRGKLPELIQQCKKLRPQISWPESANIVFHEIADPSVTNSTSSNLIIAYRFRPGVELSSRMVHKNIMYVNRVLGQRRHELEQYLGALSEVNIVNVGSLDSIPEGGELRVYHYGSYLISVAFDLHDIAQSIRFEDFEQHQYTLDDYFRIFYRLGISINIPPDSKSDFQVSWKNYHGYFLSLALNKINGVVNIVRIYRTGQ